MGDDAKVQDYLKANGDDTAEFAAMGFDSLDLVEFSMAVQKVPYIYLQPFPLHYSLSFPPL